MAIRHENNRSYFLYVLLCQVYLVSAQVSSLEPMKNSNSTSTLYQRVPRLSLLHFVTPFSTTDNCRTTSGVSGTCLSAPECTKRGGRGVETCAWGLGVCCVHTATCSGTSSSNVTYFTSPGYPNTWKSKSGVCTFSLQRKKFPKVCQLKLDFEEFYITGTDEVIGQCSTDMFVISGQDLNNVIPVICGLNTGQHMYVQVGSSSGPFRLTVTTSGESEERKWKIRITQIECGNQAIAPPLCLQYFTGAVGKVRSFNYGNPKMTESTYPVKTNYAVCIRKEASMCGATFTREGDFGVDTARTGTTCTLGDFLSIGTTRVCGDISAISDTGVRLVSNGPMVMTFVSDGTHGKNDIGFSLRYTQFACSSGM